MPVNKEHFKPVAKEATTLNKNDFDCYPPSEELEKLQVMVFSPDPLTGNPTSDVAVLLHGSDDGFKQFIKEKLLHPVSQSALADSSEEALQLVHKNLQTNEQYYDAVNEYVRNQMNKSVDSNNG